MATKKTAAQQLHAAFLVLAAASLFKVGDTVKVLRAYKDNELGSDAWSGEDSERYVGQEVEITDTYIYGVYCVEGYMDYPFFCLELVRSAEQLELNDEYTAKVSDDGRYVEVGCQEIPAEKVLALAEMVKKVQARQPAPKIVTPKKKAAKKATKKAPARARAPMI